MSVESKDALPVRVIALRAESSSAEGDEIVISLRTKYSDAERKYSVPLECFRDLIMDLRRLNAAQLCDSEPEKAEVPLDQMPVAAE